MGQILSDPHILLQHLRLLMYLGSQGALKSLQGFLRV
jgi:hypothetical protein